MLQTLSTILSVSWSVLRNTPAAICHLPMLFTFIKKIQAAFGSEHVQEVIKAFSNLIDSLTPSTRPPDTATPPTTIPPTTTPAGDSEEGKKRRRFGLFWNRLEVAGDMTDREVQAYCTEHQIPHYTA